jgi:hypothetical protein
VSTELSTDEPPPKELTHRGKASAFMSKLRSALARNETVGKDSMVMATIGKFMDLRGGYSGLAKFWDRTHEAVEKSPSAHVKVQWAGKIYEMIGAFDKEDLKAREGAVSEDELRMIMIGGILEEIRSNEDFAREIARECIASMCRADIVNRDGLREIEVLAKRAQEDDPMVVAGEVSG